MNPSFVCVLLFCAAIVGVNGPRVHGGKDGSPAIFGVKNSTCGERFRYSVDGFSRCFTKFIWYQMKSYERTDPKAYDVGTLILHCLNAVNVKFMVSSYTVSSQEYQNDLDKCVKYSGYPAGIGEMPDTLSLPTGKEADSDYSGSHAISAAAPLLFDNRAKFLALIVTFANF